MDIRKITGRPEGDNVKTITTTLLHNESWVSIKVRCMGFYAFNRILKSQKKLGNKWYIGFSTTFTEAISKARKLYGVSIPTKNWGKVKVKHYNFTNITDIDILKQIL